MPHMQVLPYVPSFGEKLADTVGKAAGDIGEAYYKGKQKEGDKQKLANFHEVLSDPDKTWMQKIAAYQTLPIEQQKASSSVIGKLLGPQAEAEAYLGQVRKPSNTTKKAEILEEKKSNETSVQEPPQQRQKSIVEEMETFDEDQLEQLVGVEGPIGEYAKSKLKNKRELRKEDIKERRAFHEESQKYDDELLDKAQAAKKQIGSLNDIEEALKSGKVKPSSMANLLKGFGVIGNKISEALLSGDQATIIASIPQLLEGWKEVFGVRLTDADLALLQDKLPSIGKSEEANRAVINVMRKYADQTLLREKIARDIKKKNNNYRPSGYRALIEDEFERMTAPVIIINPNTGKPISIPAYKLPAAISKGAKLANE